MSVSPALSSNSADKTNSSWRFSFGTISSTLKDLSSVSFTDNPRSITLLNNSTFLLGRLKAIFTLSDVIINITGNIISGKVTGDTARQLSERFGKIKQDRASFSINQMDTSISRSKQLDIGQVDNSIVQSNYLQIKLDVDSLEDTEVERMLNDPMLKGLMVIKGDDKR